MKQRLVSADRFYDDPYSFRKQALAAEYSGNISTASYLTEEAMAKFSHMAQANLEPVADSLSGHFVKTLADTEIKPVNAIPLADWVGLVYLTLPTQAEGSPALSLYTHKKTGLESVPTDIEFRLGNWTCLDEILEGFVGVDGLNESAWTTWYTLYQRWNRVILFDARCWHQELQGFGDTINNCRLYQLFYLRNR
jgi:hypothetical protein